jgi:hypothetical protein
MSNEEAKQRAKNYMSLKGALEPNQIKCYCGHTSYCDCSPLEEPKQFTPEMLVDLKQGLDNAIQKSNPLFPNYKHLNKQETIEEANWKVLGTKNNTFYNGAKWQQERSYSEEDMKQFAFECVGKFLSNDDNKVEIKLVDVIIDRLNKHFEQFKNK